MDSFEKVSKGFFDSSDKYLSEFLNEESSVERLAILDLDFEESNYKELNSAPFCDKYSLSVSFEDEISAEKSFLDIEIIEKDKLFSKNSLDKFNCVHLGQKLGTMLDPWSFLKELGPIIKNGGSVICQMPNIANYGIIYYLLMGKWEYRKNTILDRQNIRFYTITDLVSMFSEAGFEVNKVAAYLSPKHEMLDHMAELVKKLGGDREKFCDEAQVHHYILRFKKLHIEEKKIIEKENSFKEEKKMNNELELQKEAYEYYKQSEYGNASKIYLSILKADENNEKAILGLAKCFEAPGSQKFATKCFEQLIKVYPTPINIIEYAHHNINLERHDNVVSVLSKFLESEDKNLLDHDKAMLQKILGNAYLNLNDIAKAEELYLKAFPYFMRTGKERGVILVNLGALEFNRNNRDKALEYYMQAIELNDNKAKAYSGIALIKLEENPVEAEAYFYKSLDEDITCLLSIYNLVQIAYKTQGYEKLIKYLEKYVSVKKNDVEIKYTLAGIYFEIGKLEKALAVSNEILEKNPDHKNSFELKVLIENKIKDYNSISSKNVSTILPNKGREYESNI